MSAVTCLFCFYFCMHVCMHKLCRHRDTYSAKYVIFLLYKDRKVSVLKGNKEKTENIQGFVLLLNLYFSLNAIQHSLSSKPAGFSSFCCFLVVVFFFFCSTTVTDLVYMAVGNLCVQPILTVEPVITSPPEPLCCFQWDYFCLTALFNPNWKCKSGRANLLCRVLACPHHTQSDNESSYFTQMLLYLHPQEPENNSHML